MVWARFRLRRLRNLPGLALVWPGLGPASPETSSESFVGLVRARFRLRRPRNFLGLALVWPGLGPVSPETSSQFDIPPRDPPPPSLLLLILSHSHYLFIRPHFFSSGHSMSCPLQTMTRLRRAPGGVWLIATRLVYVLEQTPRPHPHPAYRGRQTPSCPECPRVSRESRPVHPAQANWVWTTEAQCPRPLNHIVQPWITQFLLPCGCGPCGGVRRQPFPA